EEAERKTGEAQRTLSGKGISQSEYNSKIIDAAGEDDKELLALLITAGADVNAADSNYSLTPLNYAAMIGHTECVRLLLAAPGIDVNKADNSGWTPLHWAASLNDSECVRILLAAPGINVNKENQEGYTPLRVAKRKGHSECARLIREAGGHE
ncbi:MAG: ankyrin repeat domain-containing protein, partial [Akkermansia sp.]|nr:ankyrin repeat domain-containing protein [Akkermansia sp.]